MCRFSLQEEKTQLYTTEDRKCDAKCNANLGLMPRVWRGSELSCIHLIKTYLGENTTNIFIISVLLFIGLDDNQHAFSLSMFLHFPVVQLFQAGAEIVFLQIRQLVGYRTAKKYVRICSGFGSGQPYLDTLEKQHQSRLNYYGTASTGVGWYMLLMTCTFSHQLWRTEDIIKGFLSCCVCAKSVHNRTLTYCRGRDSVIWKKVFVSTTTTPVWWHLAT